MFPLGMTSQTPPPRPTSQEAYAALQILAEISTKMKHAVTYSKGAETIRHFKYLRLQEHIELCSQHPALLGEGCIRSLEKGLPFACEYDRKLQLWGYGDKQQLLRQRPGPDRVH